MGGSTWCRTAHLCDLGVVAVPSGTSSGTRFGIDNLFVVAGTSVGTLGGVLRGHDDVVLLRTHPRIVLHGVSLGAAAPVGTSSGTRFGIGNLFVGPGTFVGIPGGVLRGHGYSGLLRPHPHPRIVLCVSAVVAAPFRISSGTRFRIDNLFVVAGTFLGIPGSVFVGHG